MGLFLPSHRLNRFPISTSLTPVQPSSPSRDQLNNATGLLDLLLSQLADPSCADDERDLGEAALAENFGVAEGEEVDDRDGVLLGAVEVGVASLGGNKRPELVEVDDGLPEVVLLLVEVPHTDLSEVTRVVLLEHVSPSLS